jgi:hypothetical protein
MINVFLSSKDYQMAPRRRIPPTKIEEWQDFVNQSDFYAPAWVVQTTDEIVGVLEKMLRKAESFEQLKEELTAFKDDRKAFVKYAEKHYKKTQPEG